VCNRALLTPLTEPDEDCLSSAEDLHKQLSQTASELRDRVVKVESAVQVLQSQHSRIDGKQRKLQDVLERRISETSDGFSKFAVSLYETQSDLARVRHCTDDLLTREREAAQMLQTLQSSQEEAADALQRLKEETSQVQAELFAYKDESSRSTVALATDVQVLSKAQMVVKALVTKQHSHWKGKLDDLRELVDRQAKMDKSQLTQRIDALSDNFSCHEQQTKAAIDAVLKNHSRIREAVDQGMTICSREIRVLSNEVRSTCADTQERLESLNQQVAAMSVDCSRRIEDAHCGIQSIAQQLNVRV
jgi:chromosome segregation ATPase